MGINRDNGFNRIGGKRYGAQTLLYTKVALVK